MRKAFTDFEFAGFINPICLIENLQNGPLNGAMVQIILKFRRDSWKQQIYSIISISLTAWLFGPKILSANKIEWFFYRTYLQNGLIVWLYFLHDRSVL